MLTLPLPELVPAGIEAWLLELDLLAPVPDTDWAILSEEEIARAKRYRQLADRVRMVATRAALRRLLGARLQCDPAALCFKMGANDKPHLLQKEDLAFNVSHSGGYALIAIGSAPGLASLGVDIEQHHSDIEFDALADYAFTPTERAFLDYCRCKNNESQKMFSRTFGFESAFFLHWVAKEAVLKAVGLGITEHLGEVSIRPLHDGRLAVEHKMLNWLSLHVHALEAPPLYSAAIAWQLGE